MSEQVGGISKSVTKVVSGVVIAYLVAIGLTILLIMISEAFSMMFPAVVNPFELIWNSVRNLVLFILLFPLAIGLVGGAFVIDLVTALLYTLITSLQDGKLTVVDGTDFMTDAQGLLTTISDFVKEIFPLLE